MQMLSPLFSGLLANPSRTYYGGFRLFIYLFTCVAGEILLLISFSFPRIENFATPMRMVMADPGATETDSSVPPTGGLGPLPQKSSSGKIALPVDNQYDIWPQVIERVMCSVVAVRYSQPMSFDGDFAGIAEATGFVIDTEMGSVCRKFAYRVEESS
jgi:hypothetical protein